MGRSKTAGGKKVKISLTLDPELLAWAEENAGPGRVFATVSHAVERALADLRAREEIVRGVRDILAEGGTVPIDPNELRRIVRKAELESAATHADDEKKGSPARSRSSTAKK